MSQSEKSFTVSDRRHFTAEGRARTDALREEPEPAAQAPEGDTPSEGDAPVDFAGFVLGLAGEASRLLADAKGANAAPSDALAGARQIVGILAMLKDKTEGRRTPDEERLLAQLLFELRMAYVERTRARTP